MTMYKKEANTDLWVWELSKEAGLKFDPQGSSIKEIHDALKTASKRQTKNQGFPEYTCVVKDFLIVVENKLDQAKHIQRDSDGLIDLTGSAVTDYAVNGAVFYAKHLAKHTTFKKVIALGISGDEKRYRITPVYVDQTEYIRELDELQSFISFNESNIDEYYTREILEEETEQEKELEEILKDAGQLHEDLRNYGSLKDIDKPLIVSGILLALREAENKGFSIEDLNGDAVNTDGEKIYQAIEKNLRRSNVSPEVKRDKILSQFSLIKDTHTLNQIHPALNKTPLKHFTEFLNTNIFRSIKYSRTSEDYLGRFYGEFMSYSGGDGQTLGIVLTPKHITDLFCDLVDIKVNDIVFDPCAGTGGFLIAAMHYMLSQTEDIRLQNQIKRDQLHGIELQPYMFTVATTNMILRGDGKSNLLNKNFLSENSSQLQLLGSTVGFMNPPYSQGSRRDPAQYEIAFTLHLLDSLVEGGKAVVIIPQSSLTGKTREERLIKDEILRKHTLEGVITLNKNTFYGVGTNPCIAIFTAHIPHYEEKLCKFINFEDDGFVVAKHRGLIETAIAKDKKAHLLDVWFERINAENKFCVTTTVEPDDEWLHSFYYFNDEVPKEIDFKDVIADYLTFEVNMISHGREYLFEVENEE